MNLTTKALVYILSICSLIIVGCESHSPKKHSVNFTVRNDSKHDLIWVKINWPSGGVLSEGVMSPGVFKSRIDYRWPEPPMADFVVSFIEDGTEGKFVPDLGFDGNPKVYKIHVSLEDVNKKIATGTIKEVLVRILDFDKAEISCN